MDKKISITSTRAGFADFIGLKACPYFMYVRKVVKVSDIHKVSPYRGYRGFPVSAPQLPKAEAAVEL